MFGNLPGGFLTCSGAPQAPLGGSWKLSELAKSRFICLVGVWEADKSRSVVPVGVWKPPGMLRSHDLSCLSVFGGFPESDEGDWPGFDLPNRGGFGAAERYLVTSILSNKYNKYYLVTSILGISAGYLTRRSAARGEF